jgi:hypothetical protein
MIKYMLSLLSFMMIVPAYAVKEAQLREQMVLAPEIREAGYATPAGSPASLESKEISGLFILHNIIHKHLSWTATLDLGQVEHVEILTDPLPAGQFHAEIALVLKSPLSLSRLDNQGAVQNDSISVLTIGTGPRLPFISAVIESQQSLSTLYRSLEENLQDAPRCLEFRRVLKSDRINQNILILAFLEESTRLAFFEKYRLLSMRLENGNKVKDAIKLERYRLLTENCVTSTVRNLAVALNEQDRQWVMDHRRLLWGMRSFNNAPSESELLERLQFFASALEQISPDIANLKSLPASQWNTFSEGVLEKNQALFADALSRELDWENHFGGREMSISLPFHAKVLFDHVAPLANPRANSDPLAPNFDATGKEI